MKKGFTLIEVLIVVIILGILATLALPQFSKMTRRATLAEAWGGLGGLRTAQAVYFMDKNTYGEYAYLDFDPPGGGKFAYSISGRSATDFTALASGNSTTTPATTGITAWITRTTNGYGGI